MRLVLWLVFLQLIQSTTAGLTLNTCETTCANQALSAGGCTSLDDWICVCSSTLFQNTAGLCIQSTCGSADLTSATTALQQACAEVFNGTSTASGGSSTTSSGSNLSTTSSSRPTSPPNRKNSSIVPKVVGPIVAVVVVGAIIALFVIWRIRKRKQQPKPPALTPAAITTGGGHEYYPSVTPTPAEKMGYSYDSTNQSQVPAQSQPGLPSSYATPWAVPATQDTWSQTQPSSLRFHSSEPSQSYADTPPQDVPMPTPTPYREPPQYISPTTHQIPLPSVPVVPSSSMPVAHGQDVLFQFAARNRDLISLELESKLRVAHYLPTDNPSDLSTDIWQSQYGVGLFELRRVQEAWQRSNK